MTTTLPTPHSTTPHGALYLAFELGWNEWKLAFASQQGQNPRRRTLAARNLTGLLDEIALAKARFGLPQDCPVRCCYEAGRDGFWLHRWLDEHGLDNLIVDPASIEVNRRARRAKTDRLDAGKLLAQLLRFHHGERTVWAVVRVPSAQEEDQRQTHRDLQEMKAERTRHSNRIKSLLATCGLPIEVDDHFAEVLPALRCRDGQGVPTHLQERLKREFERWQLVDKQIRDVENRRKRATRSGSESEDPTLALVRKLLSLKGVGVCAAWLLARELFGWRKIANRRQLAALAGLTPTPFDSGASRREQGIGKSGSGRVRVLLVELAWGWLRWQPGSKLSRWFNERFAKGNSRTRKIGIVALARKLLVELWRYLESGVAPQGAVVVDWKDKLKGGKRCKAQPATC